MDDTVKPAVVLLENVWITMRDGCRLAARIWLPASAAQQPVPAILEYLPYRKRDATAPRDDVTYPAYARAGYAGVRVDIRGNGESDGIMTDEYTQQELDDAVDVIDWMAAQDWCSGAVGMMGISWGGFNALQVAALRPEPLKAVVSLCTSLDRYNDDVHYKNGCLLSANVSWAATVMSHSTRPPDPDIVGERWRAMWLDRLENLPDLVKNWMSHQRRDGFWQHGSICEDYDAIEAATLIIGGWADGYRNAAATALAKMSAPTKAIMGPWVHKYPHIAWPHPRADFIGESLAWWDRWLKPVADDREDIPDYRVFIPEAVRPEPPRDRNDGRWLAVEEWPPDRSENAVMHLSHDGHLGPHAGEGGLRTVRSAQDSGTACGEFFPTRPNGEMSGDHRRDDADALVFTSDVLDEPLTLLGRPLIRLVVAIDAPVGTLVVRLNDLHPDGSSHRTSLGVLNLTHRLGNSEPQPMVPDRFERIEIALDEIGYRFMAGHRLQVAISTTYWPFVLPPPTAVTATLKTGGDAELVLPLLTAAVAYEMPLPDACADQPEFPQHTPERVQRWVERDLDGGATRYRIVDDSGLVEVPGHGLLMHETREETWSIRPDDPSTCEADIHWIARRRRGAWDTETRYSVTMTADRRFYHFASRIVALEAGTTVFSRSWRERIERQLL